MAVLPSGCRGRGKLKFPAEGATNETAEAFDRAGGDFSGNS